MTQTPRSRIPIIHHSSLSLATHSTTLSPGVVRRRGLIGLGQWDGRLFVQRVRRVREGRGVLLVRIGRGRGNKVGVVMRIVGRIRPVIGGVDLRLEQRRRAQPMVPGVVAVVGVVVCGRSPHRGGLGLRMRQQHMAFFLVAGGGGVAGGAAAGHGDAGAGAGAFVCGTGRVGGVEADGFGGGLVAGIERALFAADEEPADAAADGFEEVDGVEGVDEALEAPAAALVGYFAGLQEATFLEGVGFP